MPQSDRKAQVMRKFHLCMVIIWTLLVIPTLLVWKNSILWIALMSVYAIIVSHGSAYQATRAEISEQ